MCGIAGIMARNIGAIPVQSFDTMRSAILYRGRDEQAEWSDRRFIHLFNSRLRIIDIVTGKQPMWDVSGRYIIVHNGEIYNYIELRKKYEQLGARFQTQSDTEVLLEGYKLKGKDICTDLNGMFAFAIWDTQEQALFLARDHLGKKPLFWCTLNGIFYFASSLDAFTSNPGWNGKLSSTAIRYLNEQGSLAEDLTIYDEAFALPNATCCILHPGDTRPIYERYWRMNFLPKSNNNLNDLLDEYETILTDAISIRLRSDVPLALTFSGGVDSGTIAAICAKRLNRSLSCYTIDYHTPEDPSEETIIAQKVAEHLGLEWRFIQFDYHFDMLDDLPKTYQYYDQPCIQFPLVYSEKLYQIIKPFATVVLSGNASDELFTGYIGDEITRKNDLRLLKIRQWRPLLKRLPSFIADKVNAPGLLEEMRRIEYYLMCDNTPSSNWADQSNYEVIKKKLASERQLSHVEWWLDLAMFNNLIYAVADSNYRLPDISGLAAQVEVRSPYLDHRMVEFAARLPHQFKVADTTSPSKNKYLPKLYYQRYVSHEIAWSRKKSMGANLRWDRSIVNELTYLKAFEKAYQVLENNDIDATSYRDAWIQFRNNDQARSSTMMMGFMLAMWLTRHQTMT